MKIGVDCDLTIVDTGFAWFESLDDKFGLNVLEEVKQKISRGEKLPYNIASLYPSWVLENYDIYEFWEQNDLYDLLSPMCDAYATLYALKQRGHSIRIVSKTMSGHYSSKVKFIKREFPFIELNGKSGDAFIATHEKFAVDMDVLIDDRYDSFLLMPDKVKRIVFDTPYEQTCDISYDIKTSCWKEIYNYILTFETYEDRSRNCPTHAYAECGSTPLGDRIWICENCSSSKITRKIGSCK